MPDLREVIEFDDDARSATSPRSGGTRAEGTATESAARGAQVEASSCDLTGTTATTCASPCPLSPLLRRRRMFQTLVQVEPRRLHSIQQQLSRSNLLSAIDIEVDETNGVASILWAERTRADMGRVAVVAFLIEFARLDVPLFCLYQTEQERPS